MTHVDSEIEAQIFSVQQFSTEDGPGIRTTVFFKGCPMRCPWCHNPEALRTQPDLVWHSGRCLNDQGCIATCPEDALRHSDAGIVIDRGRCTACGRCVAFCAASALEMHGRSATVPAIFDEVMRDAAFYETSKGGVTLSGGEPLAQSEAALALMRLFKDAGIHVALDTCGAVGGGTLEAAIALSDLVLFDVKCTDLQEHQEFTGVSFERVRASAQQVAASGVAVWVRSPVIPGYTDSEESVRDVARFVSEIFPHCERHDLLAFSNLCTSKYEQLDMDFPLRPAPLIAADRMTRLCTVAREAGSATARWSGPTRSTEASG